MKKSLEEAKDAYKLTSGTLEGKVGLIYPSDFGYANSDRSCLTKADYCSSGSNWLSIGSSDHLLTITPYSFGVNGDDYACTYFDIYQGSSISWNYVSDASSSLNGSKSFIQPTIYLASSVKITSGDGKSLMSSYVLSL